MLGALAKEDVGKAAGFADRGLIADAFFAKTEPGLMPRFLTADQNAVKKLAGMAKIDVGKIGGYPGLIRTYGTSGFTVTIEGRTLTVVPRALGSKHVRRIRSSSFGAPVATR